MEVRPKNIPLLAGHEAARILDERTVSSISLDLGLTRQTVRISGNRIETCGRSITMDEIERMARDPESIYILEEKPSKLAFYSAGRHYRLILPRWGHAPTVEINGIRMHRVSGLAPEEDARYKVSLMGQIYGKNILDICTGLGYTAIEALRKGASKIVSVEADRNILELAAYNPWSRDLFSEKVQLIHADAAVFVRSITDEYDAIMLDPPTIRIAGQLYSGDFYRDLSRILRRGGVLVHYVGEPGRMRRQRIYVGVLERLRRAGFKAMHIPEARCVRAFKV